MLSAQSVGDKEWHPDISDNLCFFLSCVMLLPGANQAWKVQALPVRNPRAVLSYFVPCAPHLVEVLIVQL